MTKNQTTIVIILAVLVLGGMIVGVIMRQNGGVPLLGGQNGGSEGPGGAGSSSTASAPPPVYTPTVPENATATKPVVSAPAAPNVTEQLGIFNMTVSASGFSPSNITVPEGNLVQIKITATGGTYDFTIPYMGISSVIPKGTTQTVSFGATSAGTFAFSCDKDCPQSGKIGGTIVVLPK
ncbi:cupredoxin domain-containing protein [Patescibacteria group bacterium]|nr:cupredoxin domain-containing protein [Patescibacteria group bacterium]